MWSHETEKRNLENTSFMYYRLISGLRTLVARLHVTTSVGCSYLLLRCSGIALIRRRLRQCDDIHMLQVARTQVVAGDSK